MISIPGYQFVETIEENSFLLLKAIREQDGLTVVVKSALLNNAIETKQLKHEFELAPQLDSSWAIKPISIENTHELTALIYEDFIDISLRQYLQSQPLKLNQFLILALFIAKALLKLHKKGIIHKNIKPENIFVHPKTNEIRFFDFGITLLIPSEYSKTLPVPEIIEGPFPYMSPEQTGRMNRSIDYRTDIYSLGITFYEILTGNLPFKAKDPLEWVYSHIVKIPLPVAAVSPKVPGIVSDIIMKLIEKVPEDRYQTLEGLIYDVERCLEQLEKDNAIESFPLGEKDVSGKLQISQKIYGREEEISILLNAYENVVNTGVSEFIIVAGYSGIGKTVLINELYKPIVKEKGFFISGKFDQYKKGMPYSTIVEAFKKLIRIILSQSEEKIEHWKEKILDAVGINGQVIIDLIPEVELLIGRQPNVVELPPSDSQNRFNLFFEKFITVFSKKEHPLAIFLDDLQWVDSGSLALIQRIITNPVNKYIFLIGAYRDNEVYSSHPLILTLNEIKETPTLIKEVTLLPLRKEDTLNFISDTLKSDPKYVKPLADMLFEKTGGNPFFAIQFLIELYEKQLLLFDFKLFEWKWKLEEIRARGYSDNVVDLMTSKIKRLSSKTQNILSLAACIGNKFDEATLSIISMTSGEEIVQKLKDPIKEGLVYSFDHSYKFLHDRIQEAAYSLIPEESSSSKHLLIGRLLLKQLTDKEREKRIFDIVNQLNLGIEDIKEPGEKESLCWLNFQAGKKAKTSAAYASALDYLTWAMKLLPSDAWSNHYENTLSLYMDRAECEYMKGNFETSEDLLNTILEKAVGKSDKIRAYRLQIQLFQIWGRYGDSLKVAFEALKLFDITFPTSDEEIEIVFKEENHESLVNLRGRRVADLINVPLITDVNKQSVIILLSEAIPCAILAEPRLWPLISVRILNYSLQYGNISESCFGYISYALMQVSVFDNIPLAIEYAEVALKLNEKLGDVKIKGTLLFMYACHINFWQKHIASGLPILEKSFKACLDVGNLNFASYNPCHAIFHIIEKGDHLNKVLQESERFREFLMLIHNETIYLVVRQFEQFVKRLKGLSQGLTKFDDSTFDESQSHISFKKAGFVPGIMFNHILKQIITFTYEQYEEALEYADLAAKNLQMIGSLIETTYHFYHALTLVSLYSNVSESKQQDFFVILKEKIKKLKLWADNCPENFMCRYALVAAEIARIEGRDMDAMHLYEKAIKSAKENGFIQYEALASEIAAKFYLSRGFETIAHTYLQNASDSYEQWGAAGKVKFMKAKYPFLKSKVTESGDKEIRTEYLDLVSIIKASQTISDQIELGKLIGHLMNIVMEQAGAEIGYLLLNRKDKLVLASSAQLKGNKINSEVFETMEEPEQNTLPLSIINEVKREIKNVILDDGSRLNKYSYDKYLINKKTKSIACLPIVRQTKLIGILYLENTIYSGAFSTDKVSILEILSSQAAISIENTILFTDLSNSRRLLQDTMDNSSAIIFLKDLKGRYLFINQEYEKVLKLSKEQVMNKTDYDIWPDEIADRFANADKEIMNTGKAKTYEESASLNESSHIYFTNKFPLIDSAGNLYGIAGISTDITYKKRNEKELENSLSLLKATLESTADGILIVDRKGKISGYNEKFLELWKIPDSVIHKMDDNEALAYVLSMLKESDKFTSKLEELYSHPERESFDVIEFVDGRVFERYSKPQISNEEIIGRVWSFRDVTARVKEEEKEKRRLTQLTSFQKAVLNLTDLEPNLPLDKKLNSILKRTASSINVERSSIWYYSEDRTVLSTEKIYQLSIDDFLPGMSLMINEYPRYFMAIEQFPFIIADDVMNDPRTIEFSENYLKPLKAVSLMDVPIRVSGKVIGIICFEHTGQPRKWSNEEQIFASSIAGIINLAIEHEERREANKKIKQSEEAMRFITDAVPTIFWTSDADGNIDYINRKYVEYTGYSVEESKGWEWKKVVHPDDINRTLQIWKEHLTDSKMYQTQFRIQRKDGVFRWHLALAIPQKDNVGNVIKWFGTLTDIHSQKELEDYLKFKNKELQQVNKDLDSFIYTASHDLKAPMSNIEGLLNALKDALVDIAGADESINELLQMMATSVEMFNKVLLDLSDITAAQKGATEEAEKIKFSDILHDVEKSIENQIESNNIQIKSDFTKCPSIKFSKSNLRSIIYNLLSNAIKFHSPDRTPSVNIYTEKSKGYIILKIQDNGLGIPSDKIDKLFSMFKRLHANIEGSGIGLYIIKRIILNSGGKIEVESEEGKGSTFTVYFKR